MGATFRQGLLDATRGINNTVSQPPYDPNMQIPLPGQPTSYQLTPALGNMGPYVNQDIAGFNAPQTIPGGTWNGRPVPPSPTSTTVNIPGYGPAPVSYGPGMNDAAFNGTPPPTSSSWHGTQGRQLMAGVLAQYMNNNMSGAEWQGLLAGGNPQGGQRQPMIAPGPYGRQALNMAGLLGPPVTDGYPSGGKGTFRPGGK